MGAFYDTRKYYRYFTHYSKPLTFEEWAKLDDDIKAATLFVQFYKEINSAYNNTKASYSDECECASIVNQYLIKNVPIIMESPSKFSPAYIYKVAYNCMASINNGLRNRDKVQERELPLATGVDCVSNEADLADIIMFKHLHEIINNLSPEELHVVEYLNRERKAYPLKSREIKRIKDRLRKILREFEIYS